MKTRVWIYNPDDKKTVMEGCAPWLAKKTMQMYVLVNCNQLYCLAQEFNSLATEMMSAQLPISDRDGREIRSALAMDFDRESFSTFRKLAGARRLRLRKDGTLKVDEE